MDRMFFYITTNQTIKNPESTTNKPFDVFSGRYNHGYAKLLRFHIGHKATGPLNVDSTQYIKNIPRITKLISYIEIKRYS